MKQGKIVSFVGSWGSGIAELVIQNEQGEIESLLCDNGETVRALVRAFPNDQIIGGGHCVNAVALRGKTIRYLTDGLNVLAWICGTEQEN